MTEIQSEFQRAVEQLALFENRVDHRESGTPEWDALDPAGRDAYLREAERRVAALGMLGWAPLHPYGALYLRDPRDTLKMLRETMCAVQNGAAGVDRMKHSERVGRIIAEIDRQRPLGPDGKHGDLHTPTCGCEDRS